MLIAEELMLASLDDAGHLRPGLAYLDTALAGAVLVELSMLGRVGIGDGRIGKAGRVVVLSPEPTGEPLLDEVLSAVAAAKGKKRPRLTLKILKKRMDLRVLRALAARGIVSEGPKRRFTYPAFTPIDLTPRDEVRGRLHDVLVHGHEPDARTGALVSLMVAITIVPKVITTDDKRALKRRAKEVADGDWAAVEVRKIVTTMNAAVVGAINAGAAAALGG